MVAAAKKPVTRVRDALKQLRNLEFVVTKTKVNVKYTLEYHKDLEGELMLTIYPASKIAVFYHPQHYVHGRHFETRLKPLIDYLFRKKYTLMSQEEYKKRFAPVPKGAAKTANN